ncbi:flagellar basal-body MS-ring/collar protein FliF [Pseudoroseicyclus aestuarii]|uniref:Flagellar M-ring protein n=1 Tax=Pseudoroseicyclus aestuarii TaxID=1795041 RepID=A0A318STB1_9RHOB|nr:flagellar basal-body MS-ring/collar protein FliF [Pseudoroseicyclus aestuarii]PYE84595.1 flagellar M-ring protein FliF [Pseudoroseicyclus aestuarii]
MDASLSLWSGLTTRRKVAAGLAAILVFAAVLLLTRGAGRTQNALLYAGLEPSAAGEVVGALDQRGLPYEVRGDSIWVPQDQRDSLRLTLAAEGLPANGGQGYELLDQLSGFGTTSQMFDAAYWRAKEGELARTILSTPGIRSARVHISSPTARPFARDERPTAAVTVSLGGSGLSGAQAEALRYLVASAVPGLAPLDVAIIDAENGLVSPPEDTAAGSDSRTEELRARAERLLEARVGPGNAVVELSVEVATESEQIVERRIDPESRVAISTETLESSDSTQGSGGDVTVASNLPDGEAAGGGGNSNQASETRQVTNYEISETSREVLRGPGAVRRLTVAVLVNDQTAEGPEGDLVSTPRSEEELAALSALVASAVGLNEERGDVITVRSMAFEPILPMGTEAVATGAGTPLDMMRLIQLGVLAAVALVLGLFVVRPILTSGRQGLPAPAEAAALPLPEAGDMGGAPDLDTGGFAMLPADFDMGDMGGGEEESDPAERLRRLIEERQVETLQILQSWVEDEDTEVA